MGETAQAHLQTLFLSPAQFEVYCPESWCQDPWLARLIVKIADLWPGFMRIGQAQQLFMPLGLKTSGEQLWEIELGFVPDEEIRALNQDYRGKDEATDVLSFTLLADAEDPAIWTALPQVQLGSLFISLEWAKAHVASQDDNELDQYVLTRFVHGMLHLLGQHHDTMPDYERVVSIQHQVLEAAHESS